MSDQGHTQQLERLCNSFRRKLKGILRKAGLARLVTVAILLFGVIALLDWWLHFPLLFRVVLLVSYVAAAIYVIRTALIAPLKGRWTDEQVLSYIDSTVPESQGMLLDLYELQNSQEGIEELRSEQGRQLVEDSIAKLAPVAKGVGFQQAFLRKKANQALVFALVVVALLGVAIAVVPNYVGIGAKRLFVPVVFTPWPSRTLVEVVEPENGFNVAQLEAFTVQAKITKEIPKSASITYQTASGPEVTVNDLEVVETVEVGEDGKEIPTGQIVYRFDEVREPVEFKIEAGDYTTDNYTVSVTQRPFLENIVAHYDYPVYAGLPNRKINSGQIVGLEGTKVKIEFLASMPLQKAELILQKEDLAPAAEMESEVDSENASEEDAEGDTTDSENSAESDASEATAGNQTDKKRAGIRSAEELVAAGGKRFELKQVDGEGRKFEFDMMLETSGSYTVKLYEESGFEEARPEVYSIRVTPDDLPEVQLLAPGQDLVETKNASVDVHFVAKDKLGLAKVEFLYKIGEEDEKVLTNRITGPIEQVGPRSEARFTWEMRKMDDLPDSGKLTYFVRVRDNNPTGRGVVVSMPGQIQLVKESEFHYEAIEKAKRIEEEALNAWKNQFLAWRAAVRWLGEGTGAEDDEIWVELADKQERSILATKQIQFHLNILTEKYERNHMGQDFMANRLSVISSLLNELQDAQHKPIIVGLDKARPKTAADAQPDRLKSLRGTALTEIKDNQKMAVLILERMLRKIYDWRDLQYCSITTKLMIEQQEEVHERTGEIAPKTIAKEIFDLSDEDQEKLLTLGKQQRAVYDTEKGLEDQMVYLMTKAEKVNRKSILIPLKFAHKNLRDKRVNDNLKEAAKMIDNNQPTQILDEQKAAIVALRYVLSGLVKAGQVVDKDEPLSLEMEPIEDFDPGKNEEIEKDPDKDPMNNTNPEIDPIPSGLEDPRFGPEDTGDLAQMVRGALEAEDNVLARSKYLSKNNSDKEMPRFIQLKLLRLTELQDVANNSLSKAIEKAGEEEKTSAAEIMKSVLEEFQQSAQLIGARDVTPLTQQIEEDSIASLKGVLNHLTLGTQVEDEIKENKRLGGLDSFDRKYLIRENDLDVAVMMLSELNYARELQNDVYRKLQRFQDHPAKQEPAIAVEKKNRERAVAKQILASQVLQGVLTKVESLSDEVKEPIAGTGVGRLAELNLGQHAEKIKAGQEDTAVSAPLKEASDALSSAVMALKDLLQERVKPKQKTEIAANKPKISAEEFLSRQNPETLQQLLKNEQALPKEFRDLMVRSLEQKFPPKYKQLLGAYYASFISDDNKAANPEEGSSDDQSEKEETSEKSSAKEPAPQNN